LAALAGAAVVLAALLTLLAGLLLEQGQSLHQLEDIWRDDNKNDRSKNVRKRNKFYVPEAFLYVPYVPIHIRYRY
jgi:hypothetical protein